MNLLLFGLTLTTTEGSSCPLSLSSAGSNNLHYEDLTDPTGRTHILDGDATGGGHRAETGISGKSEFPASWSDDEIIDAISDVATNPASVYSPSRGGRTVVEGTKNGVDIKVIIENIIRGERIVTGYPPNQPRNP